MYHSQRIAIPGKEVGIYLHPLLIPNVGSQIRGAPQPEVGIREQTTGDQSDLLILMQHGSKLM